MPQEIINVPKVVPQERVITRSVEQIVDVPVPQTVEECVHRAGVGTRPRKLPLTQISSKNQLGKSGISIGFSSSLSLACNIMEMRHVQGDRSLTQILSDIQFPDTVGMENVGVVQLFVSRTAHKLMQKQISKEGLHSQWRHQRKRPPCTCAPLQTRNPGSGLGRCSVCMIALKSTCHLGSILVDDLIGSQIFLVVEMAIVLKHFKFVACRELCLSLASRSLQDLCSLHPCHCATLRSLHYKDRARQGHRHRGGGMNHCWKIN